MINKLIIKIFQATNDKNCPDIRGGSGEKCDNCPTLVHTKLLMTYLTFWIVSCIHM